MVGETIALQDDPVAINLPEAALRGYITTNVSASGARLTFAVQDGRPGLAERLTVH